MYSAQFNMETPFRYLLLALFYLILLVFPGYSGGSTTGTGTDPRIGFTYPAAADYSTLTWTDAFNAAHDKFSREYALGDWKGVDWPGLYGRFLPRITQAQAAGDEKAYYLALHEYVCSIPDSHVSLSAANAAGVTALGKELAGGAIAMPGGYSIEYPYGRSVDENGVIQLDSRNGISGVTPNPRVPKTLENVLALAVGTNVELQYAIKYLRGY